MTKSQVGMVGLGVMGRNMVLNIADHGFTVSGYDKDPKQQSTLSDMHYEKVTVCSTVADFVDSLESPRKILLLVPAGKIVDYVLNDLSPLLSKDDIVVDCGNSYFVDTDRRYNDLQSKGIHFMGMGVSGGEEGARRGPSMMPGGNPYAWNALKDILESVSAHVNGSPCVGYIGNGAAGHFTKMVHNGIEYAMMQAICEVYDVLKKCGGHTNQELSGFFKQCDAGRLKGYLIEITGEIFIKKDPDTSNDLVDMILDKAGQLGTGMWTSQTAMTLGVPLNIIDAAVTMRNISGLKNERMALASSYESHPLDMSQMKADLESSCESALYLTFLLAYVQGLVLLMNASEKNKYEINIHQVLNVWKGGCIIRSHLLHVMDPMFTNDNASSHPLMHPSVLKTIQDSRIQLQKIVQIAAQSNIPSMVLNAADQYLTAMTTGILPMNLLQGQRDYFGAHTYERIDKPGIFHTQWES